MHTAGNKPWWQRTVSKDYRVMGFCLLEGLALSFPVAFFLIPEKAREFIPAPTELRMGICLICFGAIYLLPIWALVLLRQRQPLLLASILTFLALMLFGLISAT